MVAPVDEERLHAGVDGGVVIDGGVADEGDVCVGDVESSGDLECSGRIGFAGGVGFVTEDGDEGDVGEEGCDDVDGEVVRFVGEDCEGGMVVNEGFEEVVDAREGVGAVLPACVVVGEEAGFELVDEGVFHIRCTAAAEHPGAVADEVADGGLRMGGEVVSGEGTV